MDHRDDTIAEASRGTNDRALELIGEFKKHYAKVQEDRPDIDQRTAFEGWAIQKLAGLQVQVEKIVEREQFGHNPI